MMKIGVSMIGKSVICPDCGNRTEVPFQSDSRAEALYLRMKQRGNRQEPSVSEYSAQVAQPAQQSPLEPQSRPGLTGLTSPPASVQPLATLSQVEIDQVDAWIERLWTDIPDSDGIAETGRYHSPFRNDDNEGTEPVDSVLIRTLWHDSTALRLTVVLFVIVFLVGIGCGFAIRPLFFPGHSIAGYSGRSESVVAVSGKLTFETPDERLLPDADAVVIFLPIARIPNVPLNGRDLHPQGGTETTGIEPFDVIQQIEELGGKCLHTDAEGKFTFSVDTTGRYLGILISSHTIRPEETQWNAETDRKLRRFFREPSELVGDYQFRCDEYELNQGETLSIQHNFAR